MRNDYISFEYTRSDGEIISKEIFFREHSGLNLTQAQIKRLEQNLEIRCHYILMECGDEKLGVRWSEHLKKILFKDKATGEFYIKPIYRMNLRVYIRKHKLVILIYDLRRPD